MKTQKEIETIKVEVDRLIDFWRQKQPSEEKDQVLNQLIGQQNLLWEILQ